MTSSTTSSTESPGRAIRALYAALWHFAAGARAQLLAATALLASSQLIRLTRKGSTLTRKAYDVSLTMEHDLLRHLTEAERAILVELLQKVARHRRVSRSLLGPPLAHPLRASRGSLQRRMGIRSNGLVSAF